MKLNKQILEAVHKGIQLALDDYQDIEPNSSISKDDDVIDAEDVIQDKIDFWSNWVDLGLPSGTLWATTNIGADCDNYPESWYGDYFAWGEIEPKENYSWDTYKFGEDTQLTKYCTNERYGANYVIPKTDGLTKLQSKDDIATILFGQHAHIPTANDFVELVSYTTQIWKTNYNNIVGLNGTLFIGKNNKNIFIPAAGGYSDKSLDNNGKYWYCWSSTLHEDINSYARFLTGDHNKNVELGFDRKCVFNPRCNGYPIRPVYDK